MIKKSVFAVAVLACLTLCGCNNDILDPTQVGRFEPTPVVNVILNTLGVADEPSPVYEGAEDPTPEDLIDRDLDYVLGSGDIVRISIFELYNEGVSYVNEYTITETGRLSIPDVGILRAAGLSETRLEQEIADILSPNLIKDPSVTVALLQSQNRFFSIMGQGVAQGGRFQYPRSTFRLTEAIALAGNLGDFNVSYIYISRDVPADSINTADGADSFNLRTIEPDAKKLEQEMLEIITPSTHGNQQGILISSAEMITRGELESLAAPEGVEPVEATEAPLRDADSLLPNQQATRIEWKLIDNKWVPVEVEGQTKEASALRPEVLSPEEMDWTQDSSDFPSDFGQDDIGSTNTITRVIVVPADRLLAGDPKYNIVIRPGDRITVPRDSVGEFWIGGNVNAPNAYSITGRPITLKQAVITAGGLNQIAWPKKVEVIRRLGKNEAGLWQEEIVLVDLNKIAMGLQPDFFIKPNDTINVGTHGTSRWLVQLRNAFRATYGFGFIYDRNFADSDAGGSLNPF
ncbi:MAG: polysaccharide biosynthesis/export family protein [Planctomycetota bacterium]